MQTNDVQLSKILNPADTHPNALIDTAAAEGRRILGFWFDDAAWAPVAHAFATVRLLFSGLFPGYRACNTNYHDFQHTMDAFLASARLMDGAALSGVTMGMDASVNLLLAALLHDCGYIQEIDDVSGTGAKYTQAHVGRSIKFVQRHGASLGLDEGRIASICRVIECTDMKLGADEHEFASDEEKTAGYILGTADILGQMADRAYLEKLLFLYYEFREAGFPGYETEFDILRKTLDFYDGTVKRLDVGFKGFRNYERVHFRERYGIDRELYRESIERQMSYLKTILEDDSVNFRKKLKRIDLEAAIPAR